MNLNFKKTGFSILATGLLALPVQAQTFSKVSATTSGGFTVRQGVLSSATAVADGKVDNTASTVYLVVSSTAAGLQAIVTPVLADGTPGGAPSQTISVNTVTSTIVSWTGPVPFTALRVSPTAGLTATNTMTSKIIQSK